MSSKVQATKQSKQQGVTQEEQGTTTRCSKAMNNKV
jgi:hypothetical protein